MDANFITICRTGQPDFVCRIDGFDLLVIPALIARVQAGGKGEVRQQFKGGTFAGRVEDITEIRTEVR